MHCRRNTLGGSNFWYPAKVLALLVNELIKNIVPFYNKEQRDHNIYKDVNREPNR